MTYREALKYLESFINYEKIPVWPYKESLKLERIKGFLSAVDNPHYALNCIHVAGSKGKGSTCAFIAYTLRQAGFKVGLYTSPHLVDFRERIRVLNNGSCLLRCAFNRDFEGMISRAELTEAVRKLKPAIEKFNKESRYGPLSFFEVYTALAFIYFKEKKVDFVVLETGLGGRLDATNVVNSLVSAITPISYEHTQKLGNTLGEIAAEKAGIIKVFRLSGSAAARLNWKTPLVVTAPQEKEAMRVIRKRCAKAGANLFEVGKDIVYKKTKNGFKLKGVFSEYDNLKIRLIGEHQFINASVAVGAIEGLRYHGVKVGVDSLRQGLYNTVWSGRCEIISRKPFVVLDGAQNIASMKALKGAIKENFSAKGGKYKRLILVLGISSDKDVKGICKQIYPLASRIILTEANNPRAAKVNFIEQTIGELAINNRKPIIKTKNVKKAVIIARNIAKKEDLILVTGSLFVVGEARELCMRNRKTALLKERV